MDPLMAAVRGRRWSTYGSGLLRTMFRFRRWTPHGSGPPNNEVCQWHWFASSDGLRAEPDHDNGQFMAVVQDHGHLMQRLSRKLAPFSAMVEHNARASLGSG